MLYLDRMCQCGYTRCFGRTSVHLCTASLQNLAVQQDFYSLLGVPLDRSCWPSIPWCGTGGFQEQGRCFFIGLSCSIPTIVFYSFSCCMMNLSDWWAVCRTDRVYITLSQPRTADLFLIIIIISLSLFSVYRLVLWGWGLRTDRVYIILSQPWTADLF